MPVSKAPRREETKNKTMGQLFPLEIFLAADVVTGDGTKGHHVVFRPKGTQSFYRLLPAGAEEAMRPVADWLNKLIEAQISPAVKEPEEAALPPDMGVGVL